MIIGYEVFKYRGYEFQISTDVFHKDASFFMYSNSGDDRNGYCIKYAYSDQEILESFIRCHECQKLRGIEAILNEDGEIDLYYAQQLIDQIRTAMELIKL